MDKSNTSKVKGSSIWLTSLPLEVHEFRDALCLRYGWTIPNTPLSCICGTKFDVDHVLNCRRGGFTIQRHNKLRDLTASLLTDVCHNVALYNHWEVNCSISDPPIPTLISTIGH